MMCLKYGVQETGYYKKSVSGLRESYSFQEIGFRLLIFKESA